MEDNILDKEPKKAESIDNQEVSNDNQDASKKESEQKVLNETDVEAVEAVKPKTKSSIFVTESDTFDISIKWYIREGQILVEDADDDFDSNYLGNIIDKENGGKIRYDETFNGINEIIVTFKYPSQGDYELIMNSTIYKSPEEIKVSDILQMELARVMTLIRKWNLEEDISLTLNQVDPSIMKAMISKVRDHIGMKGIL